MELTFLQAANGMRLSKIYSPEQVKAYPLTKNFNSRTITLVETESAPWYNHMLLALKEASDNGECLYKGSLSEELHNESRKGKTLTDARNRLIAIDIDGLTVPHTDPVQPPTRLVKDTLTYIAEYVVDMLPDIFHDVNYIGHASGSMGLKPGANLHLFFMLDEAITPKQHKALLLLCNFANREIKAMTSLTASGLALRYPVDPAMADNSRIIYIADPKFIDGALDPMEIRFFIKKANEHDLVSARELRRFLKDNGGPNGAKNAIQRRITELRTINNLPAKAPVTTKMVTRQRTEEHAAINPDRIELVETSADDHFVRYNVNNGDSNAYWVYRDDPRIVYNFKGEPPFLFIKADPKTFAEHCEKYGFDPSETDTVTSRVLFYEPTRDTTMGCTIDVMNNKVLDRCIPRKAENYRHFLLGAEVPDTFPNVEYLFAPMDDREVDLENGFINAFAKQDVLKELAHIPDGFIGGTPDSAAEQLKALCPVLYKILYSITGAEEADSNELGRFINWLAFITQTRRKTGVAWLFHGTEGTGKGLLLTKILRPLLGSKHAQQCIQQDFEDRFNEWSEHCIVLAMDEIAIQGKQARNTFNKLKNLVTEETINVRGMRQGNRTARSFINLMVFSNDRDVVALTGNDRRFNICPRQEVPLFTRYPDLNEILDDEAERELPLLAAYFMHFEYDEEMVSIAEQTAAKTELRNVTQDGISAFVDDIRDQRLDEWLSALETPSYNLEYDEAKALAMIEEAAKTIDTDTKWARYPLRYCAADLLAIYRLINGADSYKTGAKKFSRSLAKCGLKAGKTAMRVRKSEQHVSFTDGKPFRGYEIKWSASEEGAEFIKQYISAEETAEHGD